MIELDSGKWVLTEDDIKIRDDDLEIGVDEKITSYIETWFDVDRRFGLSTGDSDYIDLYVTYDPKDESLELYYIYVSDVQYIVGKEITVEDFADSEKEVVLRLMKQSGLDDLVKTTLRYKMEDCFMEFIRESQTRITHFNPEDVLRDSNGLNHYLTGLIEDIELKRRMIDVSTDEAAPIEAVRNLLKLDNPLQAVYKKCIEMYTEEIERLGCLEVDGSQCYEAFQQAGENAYEQ